MNRNTSKYFAYLVRNSYTYSFRIRVPIDLQLIMGRKELRVSLKTGYIGVAREMARYIAGYTRCIFKRLRERDTVLMKL